MLIPKLNTVKFYHVVVLNILHFLEPKYISFTYLFCHLNHIRILYFVSELKFIPIYIAYFKFCNKWNVRFLVLHTKQRLTKKSASYKFVIVVFVIRISDCPILYICYKKFENCFYLIRSTRGVLLSDIS
jgi:hypothetical protein